MNLWLTLSDSRLFIDTIGRDVIVLKNTIFNSLVLFYFIFFCELNISNLIIEIINFT